MSTTTLESETFWVCYPVAGLALVSICFYAAIGGPLVAFGAALLYGLATLEASRSPQHILFYAGLALASICATWISLNVSLPLISGWDTWAEGWKFWNLAGANFGSTFCGALMTHIIFSDS